MKTKEFSRTLLAWYDADRRAMPWRGMKDPYRIWISEIMLQQTRVEAVRPYYLRWMERFPNLKSLALAAEADVLHAWEGLGYYARARNLLKAAVVIQEKYDGKFPDRMEDMRSLPGVGAYTAAAIASIAFGADEPAIDGNIRRVLARVMDIAAPLGTPAAEQSLHQAAFDLLPTGKAGDFNQAMMDLGATLCLPRQPHCVDCPVREYCDAFQQGTQTQRPVNPPKKEVPRIEVTAAVLRRGNEVLIARRPSSGLLGGMWEFPGGKVEAGESDQQALAREIREELGVDIRVGERIGTFQHAYTHFRVTLRAYECILQEGQVPEALEASEIRWAEIGTLASFPMGKIDRMISKTLPR